MKSELCAMSLRSVVNESLPLGGKGAKVSRARAGSALATAPRIHSSISGLTSAAMTSIPKCSARAAHPPPMTPVPRSPSVFTFRMIASRGPIDLQGAPKGASVLILGAGLAGLSAAFELRNAGYQVQVLEFNGRAGGRNWSLRGGDGYTELGGLTQQCRFDKDLYINPGPWRIPYHHLRMLSYCKRLGVPLEPFLQVNYNAYVHSSRAFGGKPRRYREIKADYQGHDLPIAPPPAPKPPPPSPKTPKPPL